MVYPEETEADKLENELIQELEICGCGSPDEAIKYIVEQMERFSIEGRYDWEKFPNATGETYFFWYWLDHNRFSDHGGSVPGWINEKGRNILKKMKIYLELLKVGGDG